MKPALSILVCSVAERHGNTPVIDKLFRQAGNWTLGDVEVIVLSDNRKMSIGQKRNHLISMARGEYVVFVDDDDDVADNYVDLILGATLADTDVITFTMDYANSSGDGWLVDQSLKYPLHGVRKGARVLITPHHTSVVKRDIATLIPFDDMSYGEDRLWAARLKEIARTEAILPEILYYYRDNPKTSVARQYAQDYDPAAYKEWKDAQ